MDNKLYIKRANARRLKAFPELNALMISAGVSLTLGALIALGAMDFSPFAISSPAVLVFGLLYLAAGLLSVGIHALAKRSVIRQGEVTRPRRLLGFALLPFLFTGNLFAAIGGFGLVKEKKTVEYNLLYYGFISNILVILVSLLNLFKNTLSATFVPGIAVLAVISVGYLAAIPLVTRAAESGRYKGLVPLAAVLILTAAAGNLFALILGLILIFKAKNQGSSRTIEWIDMIRRIYRNYMAVLGLFIITFLLTLAIVSTFTFEYGYAVSNDYQSLTQAPSLMFPMGTDKYGRCVFSRIVFGARISLVIGLISTALPFVGGGLLGAAAGHYGGRLENIVMRVLDVLYAVPSILLTISIIAAFGTSTVNLVIALSISAIPVYARTMRAQVMVVSNAEFVEAARACGRKEYQTLLRHIIPNSLAPMIVRASMSIGNAVLSTSSLSFLGLGVEPHIPEWGSILRLGSEYLEVQPYLAVYPGLFIIILVLSFNFLGDGLRDALDPKLK